MESATRDANAQIFWLTNIRASNGLLRQHFPKGTDLSRWSAEDLEAVALAINNWPRKLHD